MKYFMPSDTPFADDRATVQRTVLKPIAIGCELKAGSDDWQGVLGSGGIRTGVSFPCAFRVGYITTLRLFLRPRAAQVFRIEAHGLITRMGKAVATVAASGEVLSRAEEVTELSVSTQPNGELDIRFSFVPFRSRAEAWFLWLDEHSPETDGESFFDMAPAIMESHLVAPDAPVSQDHMSAVLMGDVWIACQHMAFFRNSLHLEFEVYKPGAQLAGLSLNSPLPLGTVQWWTQDAQRIVPTGLELCPLLPSHPLPAPAMMDRFGTDVRTSGNIICGLFADYVNFERMPIEATDGARDLVLTLRFSDGAVRRLSLEKAMAAQSDGHEAASFIEGALADLRRKLNKRGVFLEVGARGPASVAMRRRRQAAWDYVGVDYQVDANVDFVADAHRLSEHFVEASVDVVYSAEVMEHLLSPLTFVLQANRILKDGGLFIASVPTMWPLHAEPWDYWRFTSHCWKGLLNCNTGFEVLQLVETSGASVVPKLPTMSGLTRMQQSPAPTQSIVLARRIGAAQPGTTGWTPGLELGKYDHA